jgi:hypothetical protein
MAAHHTKGGINGRAIAVVFMRDKGGACCGYDDCFQKSTIV